MEEEIDLTELFYAFWKKKLWILIALILGILAGFIYTKFIVTPKYTSSVTLILSKATNSELPTASNDAITQSDITLNQKLISTYGEIIKSRRVAKDVTSNLNLDMSFDEVKDCISVSSVKDTDVIKISVTTDDPELSQKIASEVVTSFTAEVDRVYNIKNVSIIDEAEINDIPVNISYLKNIAIFAIAFVMLVCAVVFLMFYFDNTIKTEENIVKLTELPVLALIPKN